MAGVDTGIDQGGSTGGGGTVASAALDLSISAAGQFPLLSWVADPAASAYVVLRCNDPTGTAGAPGVGMAYLVIAVLNAGLLEFTDYSAPVGTNYYQVGSRH